MPAYRFEYVIAYQSIKASKHQNIKTSNYQIIERYLTVQVTFDDGDISDSGDLFNNNDNI